jgi:hypothetical protein
MKTISADRSYVDYTATLFGVRVRRTSCRTIALSDSEWAEYGDKLPLPVTESTLDPSLSEEVGDLAINVVDYEGCDAGGIEEARHELRGVLLGKIGVDDALSRSVSMRELATN